MAEINKALLAFQLECPIIEFDQHVKYNKVNYKFASYGQIVRTVRPILAKHNLVFTHYVQGDAVTTRLSYLEDKGCIVSTLKINVDAAMQTVGANISYAKRYTLTGLLGIVTEDDSDAAAPSKKTLSPKAFKQAKERIENGEINVLQKALLHFELTEKQREELQEMSLSYA